MVVVVVVVAVVTLCGTETRMCHYSARAKQWHLSLVWIIIIMSHLVFVFCVTHLT